jgi:hypothetical protein
MVALYLIGSNKKRLPARERKMHNSLPVNSFLQKDDQRPPHHGPLALNAQLNDYADIFIILP